MTVQLRMASTLTVRKHRHIGHTRWRPVAKAQWERCRLRSTTEADLRQQPRHVWSNDSPERRGFGEEGSVPAARWQRPGGEAARRLDCSMAQFSVNHEVRLEALTFVYQSNSARQSYGSPFLLKTLFHFMYFGTNMIPLLHKYLWK